MPKRKVVKDEDGNGDSAGDSSSKSLGKAAKAAKSDASDTGDKIDLGRMKFVDVREFKGMTLVDIREYYEDKNTGEIKPGKKGIALHVEQWEALKASMDDISAKIGE